jgi:leader peptidase (prepilin peptidase)/N-methyltransferase
MAVALSGIVGLAVGSFLAAAAFRLPRGKSIVLGRSACPHCGRQLKPVELIPVASWVLQRRRCRTCGAEISPYYAVVEAGAAVIAILAFVSAVGVESVVLCLGGWCLLWVVALLWAKPRGRIGL